MFAFLDAEGESYSSAEEMEVHHIAVAVGLYEQVLHPGQTVTTWEQIAEVFPLDKTEQDLQSAGWPRLRDRYAFVAQPVALPQDAQSRIIMVRTAPVRSKHSRSLLRSIVLRGGDGYVEMLALKDEKVKAIFRGSQVPLPAPKPGLPEVDSEPVAPRDLSGSISETASGTLSRIRRFASGTPLAFEQLSGLPKNAVKSKSTQVLVLIGFLALAGAVFIRVMSAKKRKTNSHKIP